MPSPFEAALGTLTDIQRKAVNWGGGALLVLAGPGSGKTQVLTCRIARLLDSSRDESFRVLALTFTNKAADEMKNRVATFVPGLEARAIIGTFHSFSAQVLRQHGVHLGISPDFAIYATDDDRKAVLEDVLRRSEAQGDPVSVDDVRLLPLIDRLKTRLIGPEVAASALTSLEDPDRVAHVYSLYEQELRRINALDFNSLVFEAHRLATTYPAIAARYRRSHPFWLIDEFQDTNGAQYELVKELAGPDFDSVFAVADDDQIIYEWNGASFEQIHSFLTDFDAGTIQLPTNFRCPPAIVEAANRLVAYNANRTSGKQPLVPGKSELKLPDTEHIQLRVYDDQETEAQGIAEEIAAAGRERWGSTAVLARTRALLEGMRRALVGLNVAAVVARRRDEFLSPEFRWLTAVLNQTVRPLDRRNIAVLIDAFNRLSGAEVEVDQVLADADSTGRSFLGTWAQAVEQLGLEGDARQLLEEVGPILSDVSAFRDVTKGALDLWRDRLETAAEDSDLAEDLAAWVELSRDISSHIGKSGTLERFLQELQLRSKEPSPKPHTVTLMTIHAAKGREYDYVYVLALAEDIMPSFQSRRRGDRSAQMEEERRNCFVAITRAKECLVLSRAERYAGWEKEPSRFLVEMGLLE